ncbi:MAG: hypothetical protein HQL90_13965 [Magnetococcales bacterium]|nr:hypothetical protein [Magnetococcales bacterium]
MIGDQSESLQRLLQRLSQHQEAACQEILAAAEAQAAELIATATAEAKRREAEAVRAAEQRWAEAQAMLQARQATDERQYRLRQTQAVLERGWNLLLTVLEQRWTVASQRRLWVAMLVQRAERLFATADWVVQHPLQWQTAELGIDRAEIRFQADAGLTAGLRIGCQGAWLDGTVQGMMVNRQELSALLLAQLEQDEANS